MNGSRKDIAFTAGCTWGCKILLSALKLTFIHSNTQLVSNSRSTEWWCWEAQRKFVTPEWLNGFLPAIRCIIWYAVTKIYNQIWTHLPRQNQVTEVLHNSDTQRIHQHMKINWNRSNYGGRMETKRQEIKNHRASCFLSRNIGLNESQTRFGTCPDFLRLQSQEGSGYMSLECWNWSNICIQPTTHFTEGGQHTHYSALTQPL